MVLDFTLSLYGKLLETIKSSEYRVYTVEEYIISPKKSKAEMPIVILRHDVDHYPKRAFALAQLEHSCGICSTYYFRNPLYYTHYIVPFKELHFVRTPIQSTIKIIKSIANFGHEIGYHYETLDKTKGDFSAAIELFKNELKEFRSMTNVDVKTVCSHGGRSVDQNRKDGYERNLDIFKRYPSLYKEADIQGEAYLDIDFSNLTYFSDCGARWNRCKNTGELIEYIGNRRDNIYILAHPDWWNSNIRGALTQEMKKIVVPLLIKTKIIR